MADVTSSYNGPRVSGWPATPATPATPVTVKVGGQVISTTVAKIQEELSVLLGGGKYTPEEILNLDKKILNGRSTDQNSQDDPQSVLEALLCLKVSLRGKAPNEKMELKNIINSFIKNPDDANSGKLVNALKDADRGSNGFLGGDQDVLSDNSGNSYYKYETLDFSSLQVTHTAVEEKKPVVEEKKPVVEEKKPVVEEKKPVVEEKKPVVEEKKPVVEVPVSSSNATALFVGSKLSKDTQVEILKKLVDMGVITVTRAGVVQQALMIHESDLNSYAINFVGMGMSEKAKGTYLKGAEAGKELEKFKEEFLKVFSTIQKYFACHEPGKDIAAIVHDCMTSNSFAKYDPETKKTYSVSEVKANSADVTSTTIPTSGSITISYTVGKSDLMNCIVSATDLQNAWKKWITLPGHKDDAENWKDFLKTFVYVKEDKAFKTPEKDPAETGAKAKEKKGVEEGKEDINSLSNKVNSLIKECDDLAHESIAAKEADNQAKIVGSIQKEIDKSTELVGAAEKMLAKLNMNANQDHKENTEKLTEIIKEKKKYLKALEENLATAKTKLKTQAEKSESDGEERQLIQNAFASLEGYYKSNPGAPKATHFFAGNEMVFFKTSEKNQYIVCDKNGTMEKTDAEPPGGYTWVELPKS